MQRKINGKSPFIHTLERLRPLVDGLSFHGGGFLPPERELCRRFDISRDTLKSVINAFVAEGRLVVRPRKGNYIPERKPLAYRVGIVIGIGEMPFYNGSTALVHSAILEAMSAISHCGFHHLNLRDYNQIPERAAHYNLDGIIWVNPPGDALDEWEQLLNSDIALMAAIPSSREIKLASNYVGFDHEKSGKLKAEHLLSLGCRKIAYCRGRDNAAFESFKQTIAEAEEVTLYELDAFNIQDKLRDLLAKRKLDGVSCDGGDERLKPFFSIINEKASFDIKTVIDYGPDYRSYIEECNMPNLYLNVMPYREIGVKAAKSLTSGEGKGVTEPFLVETTIVPYISMI